MSVYAVRVPKKLSNGEFHYYLKEVLIEKQANIRRYLKYTNNALRVDKTYI